MKAYTSILLAAACLLTAGCQRAYLRQYVDSMNTEQRMVEDDYYSLYSEYRYLTDQARQLERENETLRKRLGMSPSDPVVTTPAETVPGPTELEAPQIELGEPSPPGASGEPGTPGEPGTEIPNPPKQIPNGSRLPAETVPAPGSAARSTERQEEPEYEPPEDIRVTHIVINPVLTGGHNFDRRAGDDGISVVFEPRNTGDEFVPRAGEVSIVLLDPQEQGDAQRVARWDFPLEESIHRIRTSRFGRGLNFNLPWPEQAPQHNKLELFVRYVSDDGRVLEDRHEFEVASEGDYSHRWTPKSVHPISDSRQRQEPAGDVSLQQIPVSGEPTTRVILGDGGSTSRGGADAGSEGRQGTVLLEPEPEPIPAPRPSAPAEEVAAPKRSAWSPERP